MEKCEFDDLLQAVREMKTFRRGELVPAWDRPIGARDVKAIRKRLEITQAEFALMIGVPVGTLRNWEQGLRQPQGPAAALLLVANFAPQTVMEALYGSGRKPGKRAKEKAKACCAT